MSLLEASCPVCLEDIEPHSEIHELPCDHKFHLACLLKWSKRQSTCPVCRGGISLLNWLILSFNQTHSFLYFFVCHSHLPMGLLQASDVHESESATCDLQILLEEIASQSNLDQSGCFGSYLFHCLVTWWFGFEEVERAELLLLVNLNLLSPE